ncbi:MAG: M48 family metallopeptidase [Candidatus Omnitrophica bacterium]|nr:M48 family metallopeptidase [Candidatus Omnitrophota bacterium]
MTDIKIDKIIRSKRRTLGLQITHDASLVIRAPKRMPLYFIEKIVREKSSWIKKRQKIAAERAVRLTPKQFVEGEEFLYLGSAWRLSIVDNNPAPLLFDQGFHLSKNHLARARETFIYWYKKEAAAKIKERLDLHSSLSGLKYNKFNITGAQKRWGSCTPANNLNFSWRLIMAPPEVIDYVVTHELAHLAQRNHSRHFWKKVSDLFPKFKECRAWLRKNEHILSVF